MTLDITAVIVTRDAAAIAEPFAEILSSLIFPVIVWDNSTKASDRGAYGRYLALEQVETSHVYYQDDDVKVSPEVQAQLADEATTTPDLLVSNMREHHNAGMPLLALPGYGAIAAVERLKGADDLWRAHDPVDHDSRLYRVVGCDIVVPVLTPSRMIELGHRSYGYASGEDRTHRQPGYAEVKADYYRRAAALRRTLTA